MISMVVHEEGYLYNLPPNPRATSVFIEPLVGDVFFVGEGLVRHNGETEIDLFSLPPEFNHWEGPGKPYPVSAQPWSVDEENKS
jgi:hypothetical protein